MNSTVPFLHHRCNTSYLNFIPLITYEIPLVLNFASYALRQPYLIDVPSSRFLRDLN